MGLQVGWYWAIPSNVPEICSSCLVDKWIEYADAVTEDGINMVEGATNLVDEVWDDMGNRPDKPNSQLLIHDIQYAGTLCVMIALQIAKNQLLDLTTSSQAYVTSARLLTKSRFRIIREYVL